MSARPKLCERGLEHVDVRVLIGSKTLAALCRVRDEAQSYLYNIKEGRKGFSIHSDRERIKNLISKYRTKQIVLIRPKAKSSMYDNVNPDVELQGESCAALNYLIDRVRTTYKLQEQGFELETVSWVYVPPCTPPQSFHQDYEPSSNAVIRDENVELGTILHLQPRSKSTEFLQISGDLGSKYNLNTAHNLLPNIRQDDMTKREVTYLPAVPRSEVIMGTCVTFDTRWIHRGPSGVGYDDAFDEAERSRLRRTRISNSTMWRVVLHMSWKKKKKKKDSENLLLESRMSHSYVKTIKNKRLRTESDRSGTTMSMGKIVFSPPNFLFSDENESLKWLKGRRGVVKKKKKEKCSDEQQLKEESVNKKKNIAKKTRLRKKNIVVVKSTRSKKNEKRIYTQHPSFKDVVACQYCKQLYHFKGLGPHEKACAKNHASNHARNHTRNYVACQYCKIKIISVGIKSHEKRCPENIDLYPLRSF